MSTEPRPLNANAVADRLEQNMFQSPVVIAAALFVVFALVSLLFASAKGASSADLIVESNLLRLAIIAFAFIAVLLAYLDRKSAAMTIRALREETRDAHERTRLLRLEHSALTSTLDALSEGVIHTDALGTVRFVNAAAARLTGVVNAEAVGHPLDRIARLFHAETHEKAALPTVQAMKEMAPVRPSRAVLMTVGGVSTTVDAGAAPIWAEDHVVGVALIVTDLTNRLRLEDDLRARAALAEDTLREQVKRADGAEKLTAERTESVEQLTRERTEGIERAAALRAEAAVRIASDRLEAVLRASMDAVFVTDDHGLIVHANPSAARLLTPESFSPLTGRPLATFLEPSALLDAVPREATACRVNGKVFPILGAVSALPGGRGSAVSLRDLTEQKTRDLRMQALEAATARGKQERVDLLESLSDDLRGPLNGIIGYSEMLEEEAQEQGVPDLIPDIAKIKTGGRHLLTLANDLLNLSRIENGQVDLYLQTFSIPETVRRAANALRPLLEKGGNALEVHCPDDIGTMHADPTKLQQSLVYSVSSFCKFTAKRTIRLDVARESGRGEWIVFQVSDAGHGGTDAAAVPPSRPAASGQHADAAGLAVTISRRFCLMMGGDIEVATEPGRSRVLTIRIPAEVIPARGRAA